MMKQVSIRALASALTLFIAIVSPCQAQFFQQTNLVSDISGLAANTDPQLKNPWGISLSSGSPFWVSDQITGVSTLYNSAGVKQGLVVTIPGGNPTGQVFNNTGAFDISGSGNALFLFATLNGTIAAWNGSLGTSASIQVDSSGGGAEYTGLAIGGTGSSARLYAANSSNGRIDVFDGNFDQVFANTFTDPNLPAGFTPYNIQNLGGTLYVTYENEMSGGGIVNAFDLNGNLLRRVTSNADGGPLDSPWGVTLAPASFGPFAGALLVGNEDNGHINAFDPLTGTFLGTLRNQFNQPIANTGLWGLTFGNGGNGGDPNKLYFAAGINEERNGLFGSLSFVNQAVVPEPGALSLFAGLGVASLVFLRRQRRHC